MRFAHFQLRPARRHAGIVLLMTLLLVVVLGVMVYFFKMHPLDWKTKRIQKQSPDEYPWVEEWRIKRLGLRAPRGHEERDLSEEQLHITEPLRFIAEVRKGNESFRMMAFVVESDGTVTGSWGVNSDTMDRKHYIIQSNFEGNIDASKTYVDGDAEDYSKLFFIAKGKYLEIETDFETSKVHHSKGRIYVVGWLSPELTAFGRIHMTPDRRTQKIFEWSGKGRSGGVFLPIKLGF